jgi:transforming growth factor-beta-induced protein
LNRIVSGTTALLLAFTLSACGLFGAPAELKSIAETAADAGSFDTLLSVLPAEVAAILSDDEAGPFTVFAPTDAAFAAIADVLPTLSDEQLLEILLLHVVDGRVSANQAAQAVSTRSLGSELLYFSANGGSLRVDGVDVVTPNIGATNGVIHAIDQVLLPKGTIADAVVAAAGADDAEFTTLLTAVLAADPVVLDTLADVTAGPFTVFAPTDAAFALLGDALNDVVADQELLTTILLYHVSDAGALTAAQVVAAASGAGIDLGMLSGDSVNVQVVGGSVILNGEVEVIVTDVLTANGVIHVIDAVLLPPSDD